MQKHWVSLMYDSKSASLMARKYLQSSSRPLHHHPLSCRTSSAAAWSSQRSMAKISSQHFWSISCLCNSLTDDSDHWLCNNICSIWLQYLLRGAHAGCWHFLISFLLKVRLELTRPLHCKQFEPRLLFEHPIQARWLNCAVDKLSCWVAFFSSSGRPVSRRVYFLPFSSPRWLQSSRWATSENVQLAASSYYFQVSWWLSCDRACEWRAKVRLELCNNF